MSSNPGVLAPVAGTQSQYAKHRKALGLRGGTEAAVSQNIKSGRLAAAIRPDRLIDFALADQIWEGDRNPRVEHVKASQPNFVDGDSFIAVKTRRERAEAELAELKLARSRGDLLEAVEVRRIWHAIGRMFSQARENVPGQLAPKLVGKTDLTEIETLVRAAYAEADIRVANEIESRYADVIRNDDSGAA